MAKVSIKQPIPLDILLEALRDTVSTGYDAAHVKQMLHSRYSQGVRSDEMAMQIGSVLTRTEMAPLLQERRAEVAAALENPDDRCAILAALVCGRYGYCYDLLCAFARQLRLQDTVSSALMKRLMNEQYGMNTRGDKAYTCALNVIVEARLVAKVRDGLYEESPRLAPRHPVTRTLWLECYRLNTPLFDPTADYAYDPFFSFLA